MESRIHREVYVRFGRGYRRDRPRKWVWRGGAYLMIEAGVAPDTAEKDACRMEHAISEGSFRKLMQALDHPQETP